MEAISFFFSFLKKAVRSALIWEMPLEVIVKREKNKEREKVVDNN